MNRSLVNIIKYNSVLLMYTYREISNKRSGRLQIHRSDSDQGADSIANFISIIRRMREPLPAWSFPEMEEEFIEISESEKSLKHELESL